LVNPPSFVLLMGSPARAGIGPTRKEKTYPCSWFPRASGDRPSYIMRGLSEDAVPPRERG